MQIEHILIAPLVTEKASGLAQRSIYAFEVNARASKEQIAQALQTLYKVKVGKIRVMTRKGKTRRVGRRMQTVQLTDRKIAYIVVKEGSIDLFPKA